MQLNIFDAIQRTAFFKALFEGFKGDSPCCGRHAQIYRRRIHHALASQLIELFRLTAAAPESYVHASRLIQKGATGSSDLCIAIFWGLVEKMPVENSGRKATGYWRLTDKGRIFVRGETSIEAVALVFDNSFHGFDSDEKCTISDCLGYAFSYDRLMES
jgi:uncharacterized protein YjaZ